MEGLAQLKSADTIVGHNSIGFDYVALKKLYAFTHPKVWDTMIMSRCIYPDIKANDFRAQRDRSIVGSHSLKAWGQRIGVMKSDHGSTEDWSAWSQEMEDYCVQDVIVTKALYEYLMKTKPSQRMLELEHDFAKAMRTQEWNGFPFDKEQATALESTLCVRRVELKDELEKIFEPTIVVMKTHYWETSDGKEWSSKKSAMDAGYKNSQIVKGRYKTKTIPFNPASRDQIAERLMNRGWKPEAYDGKRPQINEGVLKKIGTPEALLLLEYLLVAKRLGQLSEGRQGWLKLEKNGRIHGSVITNGTISGRCSHRNPNVAQVPAVRAQYGSECRSLFTAPKGKVLVGCDASGLELRCLAHYLNPFDNGSYEKEILEGDIHTANQKAAGLDNRDQAKTFIYAFLYGAGDSKIGEIVGGSNREGKRLKTSFMTKIPAIKRLTDAVTLAVDKTGRLLGLDGRILPCRSAHSALNLLLQSSGAIIMKQSLIEFQKVATKPYELHANVHDEVQFSCLAEHADELGQQYVDSIAKAGETLNFKCKLDGEYKIGTNWKETH
jgi:DNA polymerase I-like protein with 3'-5' exonuclease and polymerase domains